MWIKQGAIDGIISQGMGPKRGFDSYRGGKGGYRGDHGYGFRGKAPSYKRGGGEY